jgi:hypothetical protein
MSTLLTIKMITRSKSKASKRAQDGEPTVVQPSTKKVTFNIPKKQPKADIKKVAKKSTVITQKPVEQPVIPNTLPPVVSPVLEMPRKRKQSSIESKDNIDVPPITMSDDAYVINGINWEPFVKKAFINDPTPDMLSEGMRVWKYLLETCDTCVYLHGPMAGFTRANGPPIILMIRNPNQKREKSTLCLAVDPRSVYIQAYNSTIFGLMERPISRYITQPFEDAMSALEIIGWAQLKASTQPPEMSNVFL